MKNISRKVLLFIFIFVIFLGAKIFDESKIINPLKLLSIINDEKASTEKQYIIPGGQVIGVELKTKGVLVVGLADIVTSEKITISPSKKAGLKIGDKIISIDNKPINTINDIIYYTEENCIKKYMFTVSRNNRKITIAIIPVETFKTKEIKFGFWARDNIAGIGTITYINPENFQFGAIGHGITDSDTNKLIEIENGVIAKAQVTNVKVGKKGDPGEIVGYILKKEGYLGNVNKNTNYGIFGEINNDNSTWLTNKLIEIGSKDDIHIGPASIYATVNDKVTEYNIEIIKLYKQFTPSAKSMVIKITDKKLLDLTNGIIQGMSGCPIIQDNKIVGAITHVFMNDPSKGYGIYIEWLLKENYNNSSDI